MQQITENCIALGKVINKPNIQISFLSYLLQGTKNVLIDTVPQKASENWLHELSEALAGKPIDAIILNHSEEDHSGALSLVLEHNSEIPVYCTAACRARLQPTHPNVNFVCVDHGSSVRIGDFAFRFLHTPGLHWDDNMVTFFENDGTLFSNDLFGQYLGCEELKDNDLSADELISQIDDLLGTQEQGETSNAETSASEELQEESSDKDDKLEMLFNNQNYDIDSTTNNFNEEFETDTNDDTPNYTGAKATQDKGKQAILAAAVVAVLAIAGGAGFFLLKSKSSTDILAQNPIESDGTNIPAPTENPSEADNTNLMTNSPDINAQIPTPKAPDAQKPSTPAPKAKPTTKQPAPQAKPTPAAASTQSKAPGNTPLPYVTVRSLTWEVPDYLSYSDKVKKYLQTAGKSIRLTLSSDLLLATEYAYSNQVKVEIKLKNDGSVQDAQITKSSGSNQINDIVLRTVKDTLNVVKPAPGEIPTPDFKLGLIINL